MQSEVQLQTIARFGKRDGTSEYNWLAGREALPSDLLAVCESLARLAGLTHTFFSLVVAGKETMWLARTFFQGTDNANRPIAAVEVTNVLKPPRLSWEQSLGLAGGSIQPQERTRIGEANQFTMLVPAFQTGPEEPEPEIRSQFRLGMPVSVASRVALSLLKEPVWRYRGICFAVRPQNGMPPAWLAELSPYLCVNFDEPELSEEQMNTLAAVRTRQITPAEWQALDQLEAPAAQLALRWSVHPTPPCPLVVEEEAGWEWLLTFRRAAYQGAALLKVLNADCPTNTLPPLLLKQAAPNLSEAARLFLAETLAKDSREQHQAASAEVAEEFAQHEYLADPQLIPFQAWAHYVTASATVAEQALQRCERLGLERTAARFVLDLPPEREPLQFGAASFHRALKLAHNNGVPVPRRNLLRLLGAVRQFKDLWPLEEVGELYGGWAQTVWEMAEGRGLPAPGVVTLPELAAVTDFRQRVFGNRWAQLDLLAALLAANRQEEAHALLRQFTSAPARSLSPAGLQILHARFGLAVPALPTSADELCALAERKLARPEDITLSAQGLEYVRTWPETRALVELLDGANGRLPEHPPDYPDHWKPVLQESLSPFRLKQWIEQTPADRQAAIREWIARFYELDLRVFQACLGEAALPESLEQLQQLLPWLNDFSAHEPRARRLRGLRQLAQAQILLANEQLSRQLVMALLPRESERALDFAVHALSGIGPLPPLDQAPPDLVATLTPHVDTLTLLNQLLAGSDTGLTSDETLGQSLCEELRTKRLLPPAHGYTTQQLTRHAVLVTALAQTPDWECLKLDAESRAHFVERIAWRLGWPGYQFKP